MSAATPLMRQYGRIKQEHPDAILLFHLGDFYEMFFDDAREASRILNIALTSRDRSKADPVPLCGIPVHSAENYITRLLKAGRKVAVCDQVEDAALAKGIVRREVTRVITPGTVLDERMLEGRETNYLVAVAPGKARTGVAALDFSTGEFLLHEVPTADRRELEDRLEGFAPAEVLLPRAAPADLEATVARTLPGVTVTRPDDPAAFDPHAAQRSLLEHFGTASLDGFGCQGYAEGLTAAGALLHYLRATQRRPLDNITRLSPWRAGGRMALDAATQRNLELLANLEDGRRERSLLGVLDATATPLGARRLRAWIVAPLMDPAEIRSRHDAVGMLYEETELRRRVRATLAGILDLERLASRIALNSAGPRDVAALRASLRRLPDLFAALRDNPAGLLGRLAAADDLADLRGDADRVLAEEPPLRLRDGGVVREGASVELDELRRRSRDAQSELAALERRERERTGIATLKVGYTRVFGYYFEVTRPNLPHVPPDFVRRQTLVNAERFHSAELAAFEEGILGAEERALELEERLFEGLRARLAAAVPRIQAAAAAVGEIDALASLAEVARRRGYCRPEVDEGLALEISAGRHPVVECAGGERFVPNDCRLEAGDCQLMVLTGPNMAGKSTFLRQTALIALMAQMGSFVPAAAARVGVVDRIFTRIGAADRLSRGQSTFMVEMTETAGILHHATERSLVVLDEVGRGTSTFDGLAIAWAVAESLHGTGPRGPRTLFATHYHQLTELPLTLPRARNFTVAVREWEQQIVFLRTIVPGGADRSYGIQVAQLAGLPATTLARAREILANLESGELTLEGLPRIAGHPAPAPAAAPPQLDLFPAREHDVVRSLRELDPERLTPLEALQLLASWKATVGTPVRGSVS
jgi:DNA mismatch repair protein MutS